MTYSVPRMPDFNHPHRTKNFGREVDPQSCQTRCVVNHSALICSGALRLPVEAAVGLTNDYGGLTTQGWDPPRGYWHGKNTS